jgi:hypothetical protein
MSAAEISEKASEAVPSMPPPRDTERLGDWCVALWRACRVMEARESQLVAVVKDLEARVAELEGTP